MAERRTLNWASLTRPVNWKDLNPAAAWALVVLLGLALAAILGDAHVLLAGSLWLAGVLVPGVLFMAVFGPADLTAAEHVTFSLGAGYGLLVVLMLALQAVPGPLGRGLALGGYAVLVLALAGLARLRSRRTTGAGGHGLWLWGRGADSAAERWYDTLAVALVLAPAVVLRLPYLGYSEFQGDEAKVAHRAIGMLQGREDILLLHKKGPAEILIPALMQVAGGTADEAMLRLPFAIAGLAGLVALYCVGRRLFGRWVGLAAALLLVVNGYFVGFSRIVQYQSLVFLFVNLIVLAFVRFWQRSGDRDPQEPAAAASLATRRSDLMLGLVFLGFGLLTHYETVLAGLVPLYLLGRAIDWRPARLRPYLTPQVLGGALLVAGALALYVLIVVQPYFVQSTVSYLTVRRGESGILYNNLGEFFGAGTFYNSTYYVVAMLVLLCGVAIWVLQGLGGRAGALLAPAVFVAGLAATYGWPSVWQFGAANLAGVFYVVLFLALLVSPRGAGAIRTCWLWFFPAFLLLTFGVDRPGTHYYTVFPAWALLAGLALQAVWERLKAWRRRADNPEAMASPALRRGGAAVAALFLVVSGYYVYYVCVQHAVEYKRTFPANKPAGYWTIYGDSLPRLGGFGFPYQAGWKTVGALYADGTLNGDYDSNEEIEITNWYTRGAVRCKASPRYYLVAENVQDSVPIPMEDLTAKYALIRDVKVDGKTKLHIYQRKPGEDGRGRPLPAPATVSVGDFAGRFDAIAGADFFSWLPPSAGIQPQYPTNANLANKVKLLGVDLEQTAVRAGEAVALTAYWQALSPMDVNYIVFAHVESDRIWGQRDGQPDCGRQPTRGWQPGEVVIDRISIPIAADTPPGTYPLVLGMYHYTSGKRLDILDAAGNPASDHVELPKIEVRP